VKAGAKEGREPTTSMNFSVGRFQPVDEVTNGSPFDVDLHPARADVRRRVLSSPFDARNGDV
jgi:hypothetical protein